MRNAESGSNDIPRDRVLILTPVGRDSSLACAVLRHEQLNAEVCEDVPQMISALQAGAGTAVIADEALNGNVVLLQEWV